MNKKVIVVVDDDAINSYVKNCLSKYEFDIHEFKSLKEALEVIYEEIPNLIIIETLKMKEKEREIINALKADPIFVSTNIVAIVSDDFRCKDWKTFLIDDYIRLKDIERDLSMRIELCFERVERMIATNPLTKLPGNLVIEREIQNRLDRGEIFALAYADLDNFKPFNDKYGFSRGDEVIKMLGRLIMNVVRSEQPLGSFVGHIGGDDFVYIMKPELIVQTTEKIIDIFGNLIKNFYDIEDLKQGYLESTDRKGMKQIFPIMSVSVGIASNQYRKFKHFSEIAEAASEMKSFAKKQTNLRYAVDRRKN